MRDGPWIPSWSAPAWLVPGLGLGEQVSVQHGGAVGTSCTAVEVTSINHRMSQWPAMTPRL